MEFRETAKKIVESRKEVVGLKESKEPTVSFDKAMAASRKMFAPAYRTLAEEDSASNE